MDQRERMLAGLPYKAWLDGLPEAHQECKRKLHKLNTMAPDLQPEGVPRLLEELFVHVGARAWLEPPFHCDYGWNITVGDDFYANFNLTILDVGAVTIGSHVFIAPNVSIYTAGHPVHPASRNSGYEYGIPVTIGDNVWLGGNTVVLPGVTIGDNVVIGAGSVVTKDIPANCIAVGNPCHVVRAITEDDRDYYFKDRRFDVTDY
ncbi:sugar O-acetyltransferase [Bifidobacterium thermophilum]|uniref:sugar O-acetyltransferase n=1 Tax=Bifidobacterium thermophilum TaxID=33905 RepID=UPI0030962ABC